MNRWAGLALAAACSLVTAAPRWTQDKTEPARARISIYRVVPGRHLDLLKWLAAREEIAKEAGAPPAQIYAHTDGDSWDYLMIAPATTDAQDQALDAAAVKMGLPSGPKVGLELRKHIASHTDTYVVGPLTAAQQLDRLK